jgi:hypothetical protein
MKEKEIERLFWTIITSMALVALVTLLTGCARFTSTVQEQGANGVVRVTRATAWTLFSGKSDLTKFAAQQGVSATRQSIGVASLAQSSEDPLASTNLWNGLGVMLRTVLK